MKGTHALLIVLSIAALASPGDAIAQEATERYIPIGESPGVSGEETYLGECVRYDSQDQVLQVQGRAGERSIRLTEHTRIWLDRSRARKSNLVGDTDDLVPGRRIEVKYVDPEDETVADWVKVEIAE
ncbi:MAG: hypothetical protein ACREVN_01895 [Gammaproteobacteria bacterium]